MAVADDDATGRVEYVGQVRGTDQKNRFTVTWVDEYLTASAESADAWFSKSEVDYPDCGFRVVRRTTTETLHRITKDIRPYTRRFPDEPAAA